MSYFNYYGLGIQNNLDAAWPDFLSKHSTTFQRYMDSNDYYNAVNSDPDARKYVKFRIKPSTFAPVVGFTFSLIFLGSTAIEFETHYYNACCAMWETNNFRYESLLGVTQEIVSDFMDMCYKAMIDRDFSNSVKRQIFNFVEGQNPKYHFGDVPNLKDTSEMRIRYPFMYNWATKGRHPSQQMLMVNQNTNNIIHHTEVTLQNL